MWMVKRMCRRNIQDGQHERYRTQITRPRWRYFNFSIELISPSRYPSVGLHLLHACTTAVRRRQAQLSRTPMPSMHDLSRLSYRGFACRSCTYQHTLVPTCCGTIGIIRAAVTGTVWSMEYVAYACICVRQSVICMHARLLAHGELAVLPVYLRVIPRFWI